MRLITSCLVPVCILLATGESRAMYAMPETEKVPIARLFTNLEQRLVQNTNDWELTYQLARLHSMAYATNLTEVMAIKGSGHPVERQTAFTGLPHKVQSFKTPEAREQALRHLTNALALYDRSLVLLKQSTNASAWQIVRVQLGLAWCLDQSGQRTAALDAYRKALKTAWKFEVTGDFNFKEWVQAVWSDVKAGKNPVHSRNHGSIEVGASYCEEIIAYMLKLLDPVKDTKEIADLNERKKVLGTVGRWITPILVPLQADSGFDELVNPVAAVSFDLDGSGLPRKWGWITPKAAWLVYDADGNGRISSALQMFGNVTFWIFWQDGYAALSALDDNDDGVLSGNELNGLALWQDRNGNGLSEPGEVQPTSAFGIISISCRSPSESAGFLSHPQGVQFSDGSTRPTYDWIVSSEKH
jgi:tetratricopeptide (TPR) repeat protein